MSRPSDSEDRAPTPEISHMRNTGNAASCTLHGSYWYPREPSRTMRTVISSRPFLRRADCAGERTAFEEGFQPLLPPGESSTARKLCEFTQFAAAALFWHSSSVDSCGPVSTAGVKSSTQHESQRSGQSRQVRRGKELGDRARGSYNSTSPSWRLAVSKLHTRGPRKRPAWGHGPGYFAALNQPLPTTPFVWRNDPASFDDYPEFFACAHELAHQWWKQAVGWQNYHDAVDQRRVRPILCRALCSAPTWRRDLHEHAAAIPPNGACSSPTRADLSRLSTRSHPKRQPCLPRDRVQQERGGTAHV